MKSFVHRPAIIAVALMAAAVGVQAQQIFRSVGPDGKVTYSDQPPSATAQPASVGGSGGGSGNPQLPFELRQAVTRFPVTLYSGDACGPCATGRNLLTARGVPFRELVVSTQEDIDALKAMTGGDSGLPVLTVGGQQLKGYSEADWVQYINAAGYPKTSALPAGFRNPPPSPLVAKAEAAPPPSPDRRLPPLAPPSATPSNPAGIKF